MLDSLIMFIVTEVWLIGLVGSVHQLPGRPAFNPKSSNTKDLKKKKKKKKKVLDISLLNTQHYKVRIKGKVEKSGPQGKL